MQENISLRVPPEPEPDTPNPVGDKPIDVPDLPVGDKPPRPSDEVKVAPAL